MLIDCYNDIIPTHEYEIKKLIIVTISLVFSFFIVHDTQEQYEHSISICQYFSFYYFQISKSKLRSSENKYLRNETSVPVVYRSNKTWVRVLVHMN